MTRLALTLIAITAFALPASARNHGSNLADWLPELPVKNVDSPAKRAERIREWLPDVKPGMSVTQVLVFLGIPDWGAAKKGGYQWWLPPTKGVFRYSYSRSGRSPGEDSVTLIHFDSDARVTRIETNGAVIAVAPPTFFHRPLPRGVFWRR